ncbi:hypothetical protein TcCL_NonESM13527 [Trypanosoma cruzi]|uniref:Uncharacterized protein n=1 Tax=Trypanosoma cruzi (strain CL Brener) TaxID=353153 RepID=Q4D213_TRYCC|nr:hypothetical protein Tc00.1047053508503.30 [Trypanosoma cruzi]EAN86561.1 hypothetical protein Tc00.1047053508503.30 [Trypanosoma cruzi]RNC37310.1 hypothetical protein TcCL_NonESM13527 [Trypanosoma cruzi]|eukprot:XP_808412.1 hypothetical protein [Trypanosoma cruzi strain CL Brener]
MDRILIIKMLHNKAMEQRIRTEFNVFFAEEAGFREIIGLEEEFKWDEIINWAEIEAYQVKLAFIDQEKVNHFCSNVMGSFGIEKLVEKEMALHSSIMALQKRLNRAQGWLKVSNSGPGEVVQEKVRSWNDEKEALELQMEQLRIRIKRLNEGPDAVAPTSLKRSWEMDLNKRRTEKPIEGIHISHLTERTKEALSRVRDLLL